MKKVYLNILWAALALFMVSACSEEDHGDADKNGLVSISDVADKFSVSVDQETNEVSFVYAANGDASYPVWIFDDGKVSSDFQVKKIYSKAGDYSVEIKVGNKNGISDGSIVKNFNIENTLIDEAKVKALCGSLDGSKTWVWNSKIAGHFGCGETVDNPTGWWKCDANGKAGFMYDETFTFSADGTYEFNPGEDGMIYTNWGVTLPGFVENYLGDETDYLTPVDVQTSSWELSYEGEDLYLVLPAGTLMGYLPSDGMYNNPKFLIQSVSASKLCMVAMNPGCYWYYEFIPEDMFDSVDTTPEPTWVATDSEENLLASIATTTPRFWFADASWTEIAAPGYANADGVHTITMNDATAAQWQGQVHFENLGVPTAANKYDFCISFMSDKDIPQATVKLQEDGNDDNYYFTERVDITAGQVTKFWKANFDGKDLESVKLALDFGGNEAGTVLEISNVILQVHK